MAFTNAIQRRFHLAPKLSHYPTHAPSHPQGKGVQKYRYAHHWFDQMIRIHYARCAACGLVSSGHRQPSTAIMGRAGLGGCSAACICIWWSNILLNISGHLGRLTINEYKYQLKRRVQFYLLVSQPSPTGIPRMTSDATRPSQPNPVWFSSLTLYGFQVLSK